MFPFDSSEKNMLLFYSSRQLFYHIILVNFQFKVEKLTTTAKKEIILFS